MARPIGSAIALHVDDGTVRRIAERFVADPLAAELGVDIVADPHREDDDGYIWTRLSRARIVSEVVPGLEVVIGSDIGRWLAKVIAWDFEVNDDDPIVTLELLPTSEELVGTA